MVIQIDGAGSINKGAQLMLVAVMQAIKEYAPEAQLIVNHPKTDHDFVQSFYGANYLIKRPEQFYKVVNKLHIVRLMRLFSRRLACFFTARHAYKDVDVVFDIGGFQFGDKWCHNDTNVADWREYLRSLKKSNTKIIFLPQAFGPFKMEGSKKMLQLLQEYADLIIARDGISYNHLVGGGVCKDKILVYPDFTSLVKGIKTTDSTLHAGKVCIIPNSMIIKSGTMTKDSYLTFMADVIKHIHEMKYEMILLNHEGSRDLKLCQLISAQLSFQVPIVSGLNAMEIKGVIASSYLVVSSRFHGVVNSLSSGVPCLATSWSHKYKELLNEYGQNDNLLDFSNMAKTYAMVDSMLDCERNKYVQDVLKEKDKEIQKKNRKMWAAIWSKLGE